MPLSSSISRITLDSKTLSHHAPQIRHERDVAIADLIAESHFEPIGVVYPGPYHLHISIAENRLVMDVGAEGKEHLVKIAVPLLPLRTIIKDYFLMCESYYRALEEHPSKVEAIDMGRRGMHNEAAELLQDVLEQKLVLDFDTARRLFTLICALHMR